MTTFEAWLQDYYGASWAEHIPETVLLTLGQALDASAYAVAHYRHPWHPQFFGQRAQLVTVVRRSLQSVRNQDGYQQDYLRHLCLTTPPTDEPLADLVRRQYQYARREIASLPNLVDLFIDAAGTDEYFAEEILQEVGFVWSHDRWTDEEDPPRLLPPADLAARVVAGDDADVAHWMTRWATAAGLDDQAAESWEQVIEWMRQRKTLQ